MPGPLLLVYFMPYLLNLLKTPGTGRTMKISKAGSLKMNTALEYSTRVVQEGDCRCKKSTLNDLAYLTPLRIPLMNPVSRNLRAIILLQIECKYKTKKLGSLF